MTPTVAIVGRPNVGKSTLFNRLVGQRKAIVHDRAGVTRDRLYDTTERWGREILLIDTGGMEPESEELLPRSIQLQAEVALEEAQVVIFVVDVRVGITGDDQDIARLLRRSDRPVLLAVNKVEGSMLQHEVHVFHRLGFPEIFPVSAEHGEGVLTLMERVQELLPEGEAEEEEPLENPLPFDPELEPEDDEELQGWVQESSRGEIRVAVLGRPNIGKSTLINRLLGEERHIVHDMPGTTMDAIDSTLTYGDRPMLLVDTAGVRRRARVRDQLESYAVSRAIRSIERCHITLLMIDATQGPSEQDARLARLVIDRGRGLILLLNKWDEVKLDPKRNVHVVREELERRLPHATWAPQLYISALTGKGVSKILPLVESVYHQFNRRLSTSRCNRFLKEALAHYSVPQRKNRIVRINYMTQVRVRPPTYVFWCNTPEGVEPSYQRYLQNRLRQDEGGFEGSPIKFFFRQKRRRWNTDENT